MASFDIAYNQYIRPNEGGYANVANDKGGETYAGIARNFNPDWPGWDYIDFIKRTQGSIANNTVFPQIQYMVEDFFRNRWAKNRFGEINSQAIANLLFDFHVHSQANAIRTIQQVLGVPVDGIMGPITLAAINSADEAKLHDQLKEARLAYLRRLIENDPTQAVFADGWAARVAKFPTLFTPDTVAMVLAGIGLLLGGYYLTTRTKLA